MVDNFDFIKSILDFSKENMFYYVQLLRRASDDPHDETSQLYHGDMHSRSLKNYCLYTAKQFDKYKPEIISLCQNENCRAYIRLNRRSNEDVNIAMYEHIYTCMKSGTHKRPTRLVSSAIGTANSEPKQTRSWLVDVDEVDMPYLHFIYNVIEECKSTFATKTMFSVNTKHGVHIITHPFNKKEYENKFNDANIPSPKIHEDNPTLLFAP